MKILPILVLMLCACCGDNDLRIHTITAPDAGVDSAAPTDAVCVPTAPQGCCVHIAEGADAVRECLVASSTPGLEAFCGEASCPLPDCTFVEVTFCVPAAGDAGVDAGPDATTDGGE